MGNFFDRLQEWGQRQGPRDESSVMTQLRSEVSGAVKSIQEGVETTDQDMAQVLGLSQDAYRRVAAGKASESETQQAGGAVLDLRRKLSAVQYAGLDGATARKFVEGTEGEDLNNDTDFFGKKREKRYSRRPGQDEKSERSDKENLDEPREVDFDGKKLTKNF